MEELEKNETSTQAEENTVSLASAQALADALAKIEVYTPTTWVDNSSPDIDAEHLNKPEQAIKRVTDALNSAVDVIKDLQSQVTKNAGDISTVNNNLSKWKLGHSSNYFLAGNDMSGSKLYLATGQNLNNFYQLYADEDYLRFGKQSGGNWTECWRAALKSDLISGAEFGGIKFYTVENSTNQIVTRKISAQNGGHLTGLLIVDYNGTAGIFAVGKIGGVKTLVGLPGFDAPSILNDVLSVQLSAWGSATLIGYGDATIS